MSLAFLASLGGLATQRGVAALAMQGLSESSFGSAVLAGMTLAKWRIVGPVLGGLLHDLLGPRGGVGLTALLVGSLLVVMSRHSGLEAPWDQLAGGIGVGTGMAAAVVPAACVFLLGTRHMGYHYGLLYLGFALGEVLMVPLAEVIAAEAALMLVVIAAAFLALGIASFWLRPPEPHR
jgi:hypothetical protein